MKIEIISGSPRNAGVTKRVALHLKRWLQSNTDHKADLIDLNKWNLPPVQSVFVSVDKTPDEFQPLAERMFDANAFILVTPEYNGSYSPAIKNLLDHFPKQHHKPFGIVTASPGAMGASGLHNNCFSWRPHCLVLHRLICSSFLQWTKNLMLMGICWRKVLKKIFTTLCRSFSGWQRVWQKKK
jgi:multimeric flavodoxin WrbA